MRTHRTVASVVGTTVLAVLAGTAAFGGAGARAAEAADCADFATPVTQLVRPDDGGDLLSRWSREIAGAKERHGFTEDRGVVAKVASRAATGLVPVWRLQRGGDFVWATEGADADRFVTAGYDAQFVEFYASTAPRDCLEGMVRLQRGGVHRVATQGEVPGLERAGWTSDGVTFFVVSTRESNPVPPADDTFSIAVIPDTQHETREPKGTRFSNRVTWLVENQKELNLRYTIQVGDLSDWGNVDPSQFAKASEEIKPLEAVMPWSVAAGNHDTAAVCVKGSACPGADTRVAARDVSVFNRYFPPSRFPMLRDTYQPGGSENSYATFSAGGTQWLVLTLELWARPEVVAWANRVVAANPERNVIINTHAYLAADGSISGSNGGYGATSPRYVFDNLVKKHRNIVMVVSGHEGQSAVRTDTGEKGNRIVSLLQTFHSGTNPVRLVEVDTGAGTVKSTVYVPDFGQSYPEYATSTAGMTFR